MSKVLWILADPSDLMAITLGLGCVLAFARPRWGTRFMIAGATSVLICGVLPLGTLLLLPLENRFVPPAVDSPSPAGIIVLGGAIDPAIGAARGSVAITEAATRLTEAAALARHYPGARLVYTGGSNSLVARVDGEADEARHLWVDLGIDPGRITVENRSRNTFENAQSCRDLLRPGPGQRWILVTSAYHMPRAVGLFRAAGFAVIPYPVDYRTTGTGRDFAPNRNVASGLSRFDLAMREWIGLVAYRLAGKTSSLLPAP